MSDRGVHHGNSACLVQKVGTDVQSRSRGHQVIHKNNDASANRFPCPACESVGAESVLSAVILPQLLLLEHTGMGTSDKLSVAVATSARQRTAETLSLIKTVLADRLAAARRIADDNGRCFPVGEDGKKEDADSYFKTKSKVEETKNEDFVLWLTRKKYKATKGTNEAYSKSTSLAFHTNRATVTIKINKTSPATRNNGDNKFWLKE